VINRNLVLKLMNAREISSARELFKGYTMRWLTAVSMRGSHDFLVKFFVASGREDANARVPYCMVDEEDLARLFEPDSELAFVVKPEQMYKFRGVVIPDNTSEEWARQETAVLDLLGSDAAKRQLLVQRICKLAGDWNTPEVSEAERQEVSSIFAQQRVADNSLTDQQASVLVKIEGSRDSHWDPFERDIVKNWLCKLQEARSVYKVSPSGKHAGGWDYWLDLVAGSNSRIDQIVDEMHDRASALNIKIGSQTLGLRYFLKRDSVEGVWRSAQIALLSNFMLDGSARAVWANGRSALDVGRLLHHYEIANAIAAGFFHQKDAIGWPAAVAGVGREQFVKVFAHLVWGNFANDVQIRDDELLKAHNEFLHIYKVAEEIAEKIVEAQLGGPYKTVIRTWAAARNRPEDRLRAMLDNRLLGLIEYLPHGNFADFQNSGAVTKFRQDFLQHVLPIRNRLSHTLGYRDLFDFVRGGIDSVNTAMQSLHALLNALKVLVKLRARASDSHIE
jgi:hypothetical protein